MLAQAPHLASAGAPSAVSLFTMDRFRICLGSIRRLPPLSLPLYPSTSRTVRRKPNSSHSAKQQMAVHDGQHHIRVAATSMPALFPSTPCAGDVCREYSEFVHYDKGVITPVAYICVDGRAPSYAVSLRDRLPLRCHRHRLEGTLSVG